MEGPQWHLHLKKGNFTKCPKFEVLNIPLKPITELTLLIPEVKGLVDGCQSGKSC